MTTQEESIAHLSTTQTDKNEDATRKFFSVDEAIRQMVLLSNHPLFQHPSMSHKPKLFSTSEEVSIYIDTNFDALLLDCDGVIYRDSHHVIPQAQQVITHWSQKKNKKLLFVTNNAGQTRQDLHSKLNKLLQLPPSCQVENMITSGYSAGKYLLHISSTVRPIQYIHVVGEDALRRELEAMGFVIVGTVDPSSSSSSMTREECVQYPFDEIIHRLDCVLVGLDTAFHYRKLCIATNLLKRHPDALFIATNEDSYDVVGNDSRYYPGNGSILRALECASQRKALNVGKPTRILVDLLIREHSLNPSTTLMVGDRLDTDIKFGWEGGMNSALVLTGCTDADTLIQTMERAIKEEGPADLVPHIVFPHIGMLVHESTS